MFMSSEFETKLEFRWMFWIKAAKGNLSLPCDACPLSLQWASWPELHRNGPFLLWPRSHVISALWKQLPHPGPPLKFSITDLFILFETICFHGYHHALVLLLSHWVSIPSFPLGATEFRPVAASLIYCTSSRPPQRASLASCLLIPITPKSLAERGAITSR